MSNTKNTEEPQSAQKTRDPEGSDDLTDNSDRTERPGPMELLRLARGQLAELTGREVESVSSFEQNEEGWAFEVEVVELERVPDTMSLLASYRVQLDPEGRLTGYRRVRRYERGRADAHRPGGR
ncbi:MULTISPECIES: gas vesicle protein GvpO [Streptomyces]|jgi:hypothetical protein|uniref:Gas vesicle protein n=1 Tax=Streptomyces virens TaxID=285572 RepID=A0ABP6P5N3_9ACTN|nr:gas vesicle protein GvpO [Streptomyces calvus]GGP52581.1 gas vesicle protein [Streptomyces calvus]